MGRAKNARKDLEGQKFGEWLVLRPGKDVKTNRGAIRPRWICKCNKCQKEHSVDQYALVAGRSTQCKACATRHFWYRND